MELFRPNIAAMRGYEPGFQPREPGFVKLNTNENPYPPSPRVLEAIRSAGPDLLRRYPDPMADKFRRAAAGVLGLRPEQILCGNGSDELLSIAVRAFCGEGDVLAFPWPTYSLYETLAQIQGARTLKVEFPEDYSLPEGLFGTDARLTLLCNPNAPSGTLVPPERVRALAESLQGVLLVDEAYVDFADTNCLGLVERCPNVLVARTLSKSYSLAGLRFGFLAGDEALIEGLVKVKDSYNVDALSIEAATAAIEDQAWLRRNVEAVRRTRERLRAALEAMGFQCWPSQTNFVLARVPQGVKAGELYEELFRRRVLVRYFDQPRLDDCLRITVGSDQETDVLLATLAEVLRMPAPSADPQHGAQPQ